MLKRLFFIALALLSLSLHAARETFRIAHQNNYPPFIYVKNGRSQGLLVDILKEVARLQKLEIQFVPVPFAELQKTLAKGEVQAIVPLAITKERKENYDFSAPLSMTGGGLFVRSADKTPANLASLIGKIVVTPKTSPYSAYIQENAPEINLVITENYEKSFDYILSGKADAAALNFQVGRTLTQKSFSGKIRQPQKMFTELPLALASEKEKHQKFLSRLNLGLKTIRKNGTLKWLHKKWNLPYRTG